MAVELGRMERHPHVPSARPYSRGSESRRKAVLLWLTPGLSRASEKRLSKTARPLLTWLKSGWNNSKRKIHELLLTPWLYLLRTNSLVRVQ